VPDVFVDMRLLLYAVSDEPTEVEAPSAKSHVPARLDSDRATRCTTPEESADVVIIMDDTLPEFMVFEYATV
jgi:hypothetical protein